MKSNTTPAPSKLLKKFDATLKDLLMADLAAFKAKNAFEGKSIIAKAA
ncbi:hypothetical protein LLH06_02275 [Mucilaginibacter daejeonensis]|nr:hypothetical protein [Mucilaginibacter daejeonensis]UEG53799.1 hypothetical protein LLH06_02275 [Mucilaginibacter daejeonensis]